MDINETDEINAHDASFSTLGTQSVHDSPTKGNRHLRSNVYIADIAASSILDDLASVNKGGSRIFSSPGYSPKSGVARNDVTGIHGEEKLMQMKQNVEQSKDRAQMIAAVSMCIIHIALLKDTLDAGKNASSYYPWLLSFIIVALILQTFAGLVAIYVAYLRSHQNESAVLCGCATGCLPCTCQKRNAKDLDIENWFEDFESEEHDADKTQIDKSKCCPFKCSMNSESSSMENNVLDVYGVWSKRAVQAEIKSADIDDEVKLLTDTVNRARKELQELESLDDNASVFDSRLEEIKDRLVKAEEARLKMEKRRFQVKKLKSQGDVLRKYVDFVEQKNMLRRLSFWQGLLNIMLYIIFVLNAVIVGFGLSNKSFDANHEASNKTGNS